MEPKNTLSITDNRTGRTYEIPIENDTVRAMDLRQIKVADEDFGMMLYDPAFTNTASCKSRITYIDGDRGILEYRGYPIEELAEKSTYLETAYLILQGELPTSSALKEWSYHVTHHTLLHENIKKFIDGFRYDAHPMGMVISAMAALSTYYPQSKKVQDAETRRLQSYRLIGKMITLAAFAYRHSRGLPYVYPSNDLSYTGNFLSMLFRMTERPYEPDPVLERALDVLFILHADHEQNCSTSAMRGVGSSQADPYVSMAAAAAALYGPLHGGANEAVLRMLSRIGNLDRVPDFIRRVKAGETRLMGFGHRVYKNHDPRATILKGACSDVIKAMGGSSQLLEIAMRLEEIALNDEYFVKRNLYPNVDFYSGVIYQAIGFPVNMFTVIFAMGRLPGWIAQWREMRADPSFRIGRPRQIYTGATERPYPSDR